MQLRGEKISLQQENNVELCGQLSFMVVLPDSCMGAQVRQWVQPVSCFISLFQFFSQLDLPVKRFVQALFSATCLSLQELKKQTGMEIFLLSPI